MSYWPHEDLPLWKRRQIRGFVTGWRYGSRYVIVGPQCFLLPYDYFKGLNTREFQEIQVTEKIHGIVPFDEGPEIQTMSGGLRVVESAAEVWAMLGERHDRRAA